MLTQEQAVELAARCDLRPWAPDLLAEVRLGWALEAGGGVAGVGASKIGGCPDLPVGVSWPRNERGVPLMLLAQLRTPDPQATPEGWTIGGSWGGPRGLMRVFADLVDNPWDMCRATVLFDEGHPTLRRAALPPLPDPWPQGGPADWRDSDERVRELPEVAVDLVPFLSAPETHPGLRASVWDNSPGPPARYEQWFQALRASGDARRTLHTVLGHPLSVQDDVRLHTALNADWLLHGESAGLDSVDAWRPLLTIADDEHLGLDIADSGSLSVQIPTSDLAEGRYDRAVCVVETC